MTVSGFYRQIKKSVNVKAVVQTRSACDRAGVKSTVAVTTLQAHDYLWTIFVIFDGPDFVVVIGAFGFLGAMAFLQYVACFITGVSNLL